MLFRLKVLSRFQPRVHPVYIDISKTEEEYNGEILYCAKRYPIIKYKIAHNCYFKHKN